MVTNRDLHFASPLSKVDGLTRYLKLASSPGSTQLLLKIREPGDEAT